MLRVLRVYHSGRDPAHRRREDALAARGVDLTLVVPSAWPDAGSEQMLSPTSYPVVELPVSRPGDVNRHRYESASSIVSAVREFDPDVVDLHEEPFSAVVAQLLRALPVSVPVVSYTAQNVDKRWPPPFAQWERRAFARLAGIYPCSRQAASVVAGKGYRGVVAPLALGIPADVYSAGSQSLSDDVVRIGLVGRLVPEKGGTDAVAVAAAVARVRPCVLVVVGDGPSRDELSSYAASLGVSVEHHPWVGQQELAALYRTMHVVLAPSRATSTWVEQFGRMLIEAQASGAVVAGYASGTIADVAGIDAAVIVPEGDTDALAAAVAAVVGDASGWARRRRLGLERVTSYLWASIAEEQLAFYERARAAPMPPAPVRPSPAVRAAARAQWGPTARLAGGSERPFALPVLRNGGALAKALASGLDVVERLSAR